MVFNDAEKKLGVELVTKFFSKYSREELIALLEEFHKAKKDIFGALFFEQAEVGTLGEDSQKIYNENSIVKLSFVLEKYLSQKK